MRLGFNSLQARQAPCQPCAKLSSRNVALQISTLRSARRPVFARVAELEQPAAPVEPAAAPAPVAPAPAAAPAVEVAQAPAAAPEPVAPTPAAAPAVEAAQAPAAAPEPVAPAPAAAPAVEAAQAPAAAPSAERPARAPRQPGSYANPQRPRLFNNAAPAADGSAPAAPAPAAPRAFKEYVIPEALRRDDTFVVHMGNQEDLSQLANQILGHPSMIQHGRLRVAATNRRASFKVIEALGTAQKLMVASGNTLRYSLNYRRVTSQAGMNPMDVLDQPSLQMFFYVERVKPEMVWPTNEQEPASSIIRISKSSQANLVCPKLIADLRNKGSLSASCIGYGPLTTLIKAMMLTRLALLSASPTRLLQPEGEAAASGTERCDFYVVPSEEQTWINSAMCMRVNRLRLVKCDAPLPRAAEDSKVGAAGAPAWGRPHTVVVPVRELQNIQAKLDKIERKLDGAVVPQQRRPPGAPYAQVPRPYTRPNPYLKPQEQQQQVKQPVAAAAGQPAAAQKPAEQQQQQPAVQQPQQQAEAQQPAAEQQQQQQQPAAAEAQQQQQ